ncbi:MAG: glutaminase domain-containing protein [Bryobacteraceae bacterium]
MDSLRSLTKRNFLKSALGLIAARSGAARVARPKPQRLRPPSVPLIACDPYLSIWSSGDLLADTPTTHWTGHPNRLTSLVRIDGNVFRILGNEPKGVPALPQTALSVHPTRTVYEFEGAGVHLSLEFLTAALPDDLMILSRPLGYLTWTARATDGKAHDVSVYWEANGEIAVNEPSQPVVWSRVPAGPLNVLRIGTAAQTFLEPKGDDVRVDWGYLYLAAPESERQTQAIALSWQARRQFSTSGTVSDSHSLQMPRAVAQNAPVLVFAFDLGSVGTASVSRWAMLAYDEIYAIQFFGENLRPYWRRSGATATDLLAQAASEYPALRKQCAAFDRELMDDVREVGGEQYAQICALTYRQCIAGTQIASDTNGQPLLFPKENTSNGCIGTVDVIYPMSPQFLLFGSSLSRAMLVYILEYASSSRWHFPFAPHDVGTFPQANGQVYGGGEHSEVNQMPVEETGNMLLLLAALSRIDGDTSFAERYWPTIQKWAEYLKQEGLDPKNQLSTDDFAGHLAHNANLSIKAILALGAYSLLCRVKGERNTADAYLQLAKGYAQRWIGLANDGDHFRLAFDKPGTWSQKYNLVWDRILDLNLFPPEVARKEMAFYRKHLNRYGLPLDNRKAYTKTDWSMWTATLTGSRADFDALTERVHRFLDSTPDRVPCSDFYWTRDAFDAGMHARPVVGGIFLALLYEPRIWKKWASRNKAHASGLAPFPKTGESSYIEENGSRTPGK